MDVSTGSSLETVEFDPRLQSPFTMLIAGPTSCGKSHLVFDIISNAQALITPQVHDITYCYSQWQPGFKEMQDLGVKFHQGLQSREELFDESRDTSKHSMLIIDDLLDPEYAPLAKDLFIKGSHHLNMNVIFITQNLFFANKDFRTLSLNAHYLVVFKNPRDMSQISYISRQAFPSQPSFLTQVYNSETQKRHSYIVLDCKQATPDHLRVRNSVTTPWNTIVFIPKAKKR
jgi:hypothetical protein